MRKFYATSMKKRLIFVIILSGSSGSQSQFNSISCGQNAILVCNSIVSEGIMKNRKYSNFATSCHKVQAFIPCHLNYLQCNIFQFLPPRLNALRLLPLRNCCWRHSDNHQCPKNEHIIFNSTKCL